MCTVVVAGLAMAPAAGAATLPVGSSAGVSVKPVKDGVRVTFGSEARGAFGRIAGRKIQVRCEKVEKAPSGYSVGAAISHPERAPKRRRPFRAGVPTRGLDLCRVIRSKIVRHPRKGVIDVASAEEVAAVPLTQRGAVYLDERASAARLLIVVNAALDRASTDGGRLPSFARLNAAIDVPALRPMASINALPAAGTIGYYTDGGVNGAAASITRSGRRVYVEVGPDGRLATNLVVYLTASDDD